MDRHKIHHPFHVGPAEDEGNVRGARARMVSPPAGEGGNEGVRGRGQPGSEAAAAEGEGAEEISAEGAAAGGDAGFMSHWNQEGLGATGCDQENEKQPEEPVPNYMGDSENVKPLPGGSCANPVRVLVPECRPRTQHRFTLLQLQELESIFQCNQYISSSEAEMVFEEERKIQEL
ncbi:Reproductive homeobox 2A [Apodemus speciosus]|uniref:Reproductive homeobox 2A n=1 Tax=Apodemus speciosus TaxID=105296 RepID=A0ABQ0FTY9_APOSI